MTRLVVLLARFSARHRALVLVAWAVLAVGLLAGSRILGSGLADELSVPGSDSAAASSVIAAVGGDAPPDDGPATSDVLVAVADGPIADRADDVAYEVHVREDLFVYDLYARRRPAAVLDEPAPEGEGVPEFLCYEGNYRVQQLDDVFKEREHDGLRRPAARFALIPAQGGL